MDASIEYGLLLKSHSADRAKELISERYSIYGDQKPFLTLHERQVPAPEPVKRRAKKSRINADLAEFLEGPHLYKDYVKLNTLWKGYIGTVLTKSDKSVAMAAKLLTADWHGATARVVACKSPGFVGKRGIIVWEARTQLVIVCDNNRVYKIPKKGTVFELEDLEQPVQIIGTRVMCRSAERTTRKFKPHDTRDIAGLVHEAA